MTTTTGAATPFRPKFERLAARAERHLEALRQICEEAWELRDRMIDEFDIDSEHDGAMDAFDEVYGFELLNEAMEAAGM